MCDRLRADRTQRGVTAIGNGQYRGTTAVGVGAVDPVAAWQDSEFGGLRQAHDALWFVTLTRRAHADGALQPLHLGAEPLHLGLVVLQLGAEVDDLRVLPGIRSCEVVVFSEEGGDLHLLPANLVVLLPDDENEELRWRAVGQTKVLAIIPCVEGRIVSKLPGALRAPASVRGELRRRTGGTSGRTFGRGAAESGAASALAGARLGLRIDAPRASHAVPEKDFGRRWRGLEAQTGHSGLRKCCLNMWVCVSVA
jgi:hypothetical protein